MRSTYLVFLFNLILSLAWAEPLKFKDFISKSEKLRSELRTAKTFSEKKIKLKELEDSFKISLQEYKKQSPDEGGKEESLVVRFYYSLEPVFGLATDSFSEEGCKKAFHQIQIEDRDMTQPNSKLSIEAEEAIRVLKVICPKI